MKKIANIIAAVVCCFNAFATNVTAWQDSALSHYISNDYETALQYYDSIYAADYASSDLFYNMGNCHYCMEHVAAAVYFYEKALLLSPNDKDVRYNLSLAQALVKNTVEAVPEVFYVRWFKSLCRWFTPDTWAWSSIALFVVALLALLLFLFSRKIGLRKTGFAVAIVLMVFSISTFAVAKYSANDIVDNRFAIVFETDLVKSSPIESSDNLFEISEGFKVEVLDTLNNWANIRLPDGKQGWIKSGKLKELGMRN